MVAVCGRFTTFHNTMVGGGDYHVVESRIFQTLLRVFNGETFVDINYKSRCRLEILLLPVSVILPVFLLGINFPGDGAVVSCGEGFRQIRYRGSLGLISDGLGCV